MGEATHDTGVAAAARAVAATRGVAPARPDEGDAAPEGMVRRVPRLRRDIGWIVAFSLAANLLLLTTPLHMMTVYDRVLASGSGGTLFWITAIALAALALFGIAEVVRMMIAQRMAAAYVAHTAGPMFAALVREETPERAAILRDFYAVRTTVASRALMALFDLPFAPIFLALLFMLHVQIGFLTLAGVAALASLAWAERRWIGDSAERAARASAEAVTFSQSFVQRSEDIRAMGLLPQILRHWGNRMGRALTHADDAAATQSAFFGLSRTVRQGLQIMVIAWGAWLVVQGDLSAGVIFAASLISGRVLQPIEQVIGSWDRLVQLRAGLDRIETYLGRARTSEHDVVPALTVGDVQVDDVSYEVAVPGTTGTRAVPILRNVSLTLPAGSILAVVGPSGAGKSTFARLLVGAHRATSGTVRLDDLDITRWPDQRRRESIGYVPQDVALFPGTIAQNICGFDRHANEDAIIAAAKRANVHDTIARLGEGYATAVGPGTQDLSGGQRQQVALAAAFYTDPRVLVLDEPNAHLDQEAEDALLRTLALGKADGRTAIVVSQRRSILRVADHVATLSDGQLLSFVPNRGQWRARRGDPGTRPSEHEVDVASLRSSRQPMPEGLRGSLQPDPAGEVSIADLAGRRP